MFTFIKLRKGVSINLDLVRAVKVNNSNKAVKFYFSQEECDTVMFDSDEELKEFISKLTRRIGYDFLTGE